MQYDYFFSVNFYIRESTLITGRGGAMEKLSEKSKNL